MILLEHRSRKEEEENDDRISPATIITVAVFLSILFILLVAGMVFCWRNPHWLSAWRRKGRAEATTSRARGLGIEGAGDLEESRPNTQRSDLSYADLAQEKEIRREDVVVMDRAKDSSRVDVTAAAAADHTTFPKPVASLGTPRLAMSKAIKYVTKDAQYLSIFQAFSKSPSEKGTPNIAPPRVLPPQLSPRKYSFRSARAARRGQPGPKLTISAPVYGDLPPLTLSLPTMTLSWANYENGTAAGPEPITDPEPSPNQSLAYADCVETLTDVDDAEEVSTVDYEAFSSRGGEFSDYRRGSSGKRLSFHSQMSGVSILSTDTGKVSFAQVAMRPESKPTLQIIGPSESPRKVVVHYK